MIYHYLTADVFTNRLFGGNQLAVFPEADGLGDETMQAIAREFNYSETVFVLPPRNPECDFRLRIFTPGGELPFAGHPTIGAAFILTLTGQVAHDEAGTRILLEEEAGPVPVEIRGSSAGPFHAWLTAPRLPVFIDDLPPLPHLARALNLASDDIVTDSLRPRFVSCGVPFLYLPLRGLDAVGRAIVDRAAWRDLLRGAPSNEVFLFCLETRSVDTQVHARLFAPGLGIEEDPATGSAVAGLGALLADNLPQANGLFSWSVEQGIEMGRPSRLDVEVTKAAGTITSVRVGGSAVRVMQGEISL